MPHHAPFDIDATTGREGAAVASPRPSAESAWADGPSLEPLDATAGRRIEQPGRGLISLVKRRPFDALFGVLVLALAGFRIGRTVATPIAIWNDSLDYIKLAKQPWISTAFWIGPRPPMAAVLWKLTSTPARFTVTQTVISVLAWSFLAFTVMKLLRPGWRSLVGPGLVLAFATTWPITLWDSLVLSESISLSALAVITACVLRLSRRWSRSAAGGLILASVVYVGARDADVWTVALIGVAMIVYGTIRWLRTRARQTRRVLVVATALLATASLAEVAALSTGRNVQNVEHVFAVRVLPYPDRVAWFAAHGMPMQKAIEDLARTTPRSHDSAAIVWPNINSKTWAPLARYFATNSESDYTLFLVTHPGYDLSTPFDSPQLGFNFGSGDLGIYGSGVGHLPYVSSFLFPAWGVALAMGVFGAALLVARRRRRREALAVVFLAGVGVVSMLVAWHGDAEEFVRHILEGNIQARVAALLLLVMGAVGLAPGSADRAAAATP